MSGNSDSEGAIWRPQLPGYTVVTDDEAAEWVATCISNPERVLRGRNQAELNAAHGRLIAQDAAQHGMTPPHRT